MAIKKRTKRCVVPFAPHSRRKQTWKAFSAAASSTTSGPSECTIPYTCTKIYSRRVTSSLQQYLSEHYVLPSPTVAPALRQYKYSYMLNSSAVLELHIFIRCLTGATRGSVHRGLTENSIHVGAMMRYSQRTVAGYSDWPRHTSTVQLCIILTQLQS